MAAHTASKEESTSVPKKRVATKTATKKVAVKKTASQTVVAKRVAAKRIPRRSTEEVSTPPRRIPTSARKAPTTIPERGPAKHFPFAVALSIGAFVVAFGTSAIVGFGDRGAIDVAQVIEARADRVSQQGEGNEEEAEAVAAAANNMSAASNEPNGGFRGAGLRRADPSNDAGPVVVDENEQITFVDTASTTAEELPSEEETVAPESETQTQTEEDAVIPTDPTTEPAPVE